MIIVIIHWRIKPTDEAEKQFVDYWRSLKIKDKSKLVGEFLSAPVPKSQFKYLVDDLSVGHASVECRHFMNVGIWDDEASFQGQVGQWFNDSKAPEAFEAERRSRTILSPKEWRIGDWHLPEKGTTD